jgi:hypothetical protein
MTAVEWLLKELDINPKATILKDLIKQALEIEKQQIISAYETKLAERYYEQK